MLSVIVIGKNEAAHLRDCFESIQKGCRGLSYELIYVDSASSDNSLEIAKTYARTFRVDDPQPTPGLGRWIGTDCARGEYLLFLDGDMELIDSFLRKGFPRMIAGGADALLGTRHDLYYKDGRLIGENPNYFECTEPRLAPEFGGALLIQRESLLRAGSWSTDTIACEEAELHSRLLAKGMRIEEIPEPMITHRDSVTENRSLLKILFNRRNLGEGEAFRCSLALGNGQGYLKFHKITFLFYLLDWIALILLFLLWPWGIPVLCLIESFQFGFFLRRKTPRRFFSQKLFFFSFPVGLFTYHKRSHAYIAVAEGGTP